MKKKLLALLCAGTMLAALLAGCGNKEGSGGDGDRPVIGISMSTQTQARQLKDVEYLTKELDALGYDVTVQYAEMTRVGLASQIDNLVASG